MTKMIYTVVNRPKKDAYGQTDIGWLAECGRDAVPLGGFLITSRTLPGDDREYVARAYTSLKEGIASTINLGSTFKTRSSAAFAIWRYHYKDLRTEQQTIKRDDLALKDRKRDERKKIRDARLTPEGKEAYRLELNRKAREKRHLMPLEQKLKMSKKRSEKAYRLREILK